MMISWWSLDVAHINISLDDNNATQKNTLRTSSSMMIISINSPSHDKANKVIFTVATLHLFTSTIPVFGAIAQ
jgi:hypothetical protein